MVETLVKIIPPQGKEVTRLVEGSKHLLRSPVRDYQLMNDERELIGHECSSTKNLKRSGEPPD